MQRPAEGRASTSTPIIYYTGELVFFKSRDQTGANRVFNDVSCHDAFIFMQALHAVVKTQLPFDPEIGLAEAIRYLIFENSDYLRQDSGIVSQAKHQVDMIGHDAICLEPVPPSVPVVDDDMLCDTGYHCITEYWLTISNAKRDESMSSGYDNRSQVDADWFH